MPKITLALLLMVFTGLSNSVHAETTHATGFIADAPEKYANMPKVPRYRHYLPESWDLSH